MSTSRNAATTLVTCIALLSAAPVAAAGPTGRTVRINTEHFEQLSLPDQLRVLEIKDRLEVLMATDRSTLQPVERHQLGAEWKDLRHEMKQYNRNGTVIYISTAGIIIIILLLILIL